MSTTSSGIGIGSIIAVLCSYTTWHSVPWAVVHGLFGWLYVFYWMLTQ